MKIALRFYALKLATKVKRENLETLKLPKMRIFGEGTTKR